MQALAVLTLSCAGLGTVMKQPVQEESGSRGSRRESEMPDYVSLADYEQNWSVLTVLLGSKIGSSEHVYVFLLMVVADALSVMALYIPYSYLQPEA